MVSSKLLTVVVITISQMLNNCKC